MQMKVKIWLATDQGQGVMGGGRFRLLQEIGRQQCLQKAARTLGISYRKAWGDLQALEQQFGFELVNRHRGGAGGGSSDLTDRAIELLQSYGKINTQIQTAVQKQYRSRLKTIVETNRK